MTIEETRRGNLRSVAKKYGGHSALTVVLGMSSGQLSQLIGRNPTRSIGSNLARKIERTLQLPSGWLDNDQKATDSPINIGALAEVLELIDNESYGVGSSLTPRKKAMIAALLYQDLIVTGGLAKDRVRLLMGIAE